MDLFDGHDRYKRIGFEGWIGVEKDMGIINSYPMLWCVLEKLSDNILLFYFMFEVNQIMIDCDMNCV